MNSRRFSLPFGAQALYSLRAVFADLYQRKFATLITVLVIAVSLTIPTVSYLLWKNIHDATTQFYPESELTVYLHKNPPARGRRVAQLHFSQGKLKRISSMVGF